MFVFVLLLAAAAFPVSGDHPDAKGMHIFADCEKHYYVYLHNSPARTVLLSEKWN